MKSFSILLNSASRSLPSSMGSTIALASLTQNIPVYLKRSRSAFRKPSFFIPRMRESVDSQVESSAVFCANGLGTALPLFAIASPRCEYYSLRLPLLKAGFKRLCVPLEGVPSNVIWGKSIPQGASGRSAPLGGDDSATSPAMGSAVVERNSNSPGFSKDGSSWLALMQMQAPYQHFNHFPLSHQNVGCKRGLALNLRHMQLCVQEKNAGFRSKKASLLNAGGNSVIASCDGKLMPKNMYSFFPRTWIYPHEKGELIEVLKQTSGSKHFIWKPWRGSCGRGIFITGGGAKQATEWERVMKVIDEKAATDDILGHLFKQFVVQEYIEEPLLLNERKMDLRLYIAVTSYDPLTVYLHEEGLVRLAAKSYNKDARLMDLFDEKDAVMGVAELGESDFITPPSDRFRHLTNYSVGRKYLQFKQQKQIAQLQQMAGCAQDSLSAVQTAMTMNLDHQERGLLQSEAAAPELKWSLQRLWTYLDLNYGSAKARVAPSVRLKQKIALLIVRTLMAVRPAIVQALQTRRQAHFATARQGSEGLFELYGFDILLDHKLKPFLIEVNTLPSLESSSEFDYTTKSNVVADLLNLAMMEPFERKRGALLPFTDSIDILQPPDNSLMPYIHTLDEQLGELQGNRKMVHLTVEERKHEVQAKLQDELQYARGFKRIFPPVLVEEAAPQAQTGFPFHVECRQMRQDLNMYQSLGLLTKSDQWALQSF